VNADEVLAKVDELVEAASLADTSYHYRSTFERAREAFEAWLRALLTLGDLERELMKRCVRVATIYHVEGKFRVRVMSALERGHGRDEVLEAAIAQAFASFDEDAEKLLRAGAAGSSLPIAEARGANGPGVTGVQAPTGILMQDGRRWHFGRHDGPCAGFPREVDGRVAGGCAHKAHFSGATGP
jgi:hypothetical protein